MSNFPHIFPRSQNIFLTVQSCGDSLETPKPSATFTFLATFCNFGRSGKPGGSQCGGGSGEKKILATSESDLYVNAIHELYSCLRERGKLM